MRVLRRHGVTPGSAGPRARGWPGRQIGAIDLEIAPTNIVNRINHTIKEPVGKTWGTLVTYAAALDVPRRIVEFLAWLPAAQAPDLHEVLDLRRAQAMTHVVLDGTLTACDRLAGFHPGHAGPRNQRRTCSQRALEMTLTERTSVPCRPLMRTIHSRFTA
ncbi:hypothetical protein [Streptomyces sp. NPDC054794]